MAHSPRTHHRSPAHRCSRPSTWCSSAGRAQETHGPRLVPRPVPAAPPGLGGLQVRPQPWLRPGHRAAASVRHTAPGPCPVPRPARGAGAAAWLGTVTRAASGAGAAAWLGTGTRAASGAGAEQAAPNGSGWAHLAGQPLADCWWSTELLGQNGSAQGTPQDPSVRQGQAGAPGSAARTGGAVGLGGWQPRCWPSFDSTRPGTWQKQAQVGHLPWASLQIGTLGARAAAVPVASHQAQLGPMLPHGLSPHCDSCCPQHQRTCPSLAARGCCSAPHSPHPTPHRCQQQHVPRLLPGPHGSLAPCGASVGARRGAKGLRRLGLVCREGAASPPLFTSGFNKGSERPEHS